MTDTAIQPVPPCTPPASSEPPVLRCRNTADFLAALPFAVGVSDADSLFVVQFSGRRILRTVRADLPDRDAPEHLAPYVDAVADLLDATGAGAGGPALVLVGSQTFAEAGGAPWRHLAGMLRRRCTRERWQLRDFAVIAPDGWASLLDAAAPHSRRPLSEIRESPVAAEAAALQVEPRRLDELGRLPEPESERSAAVLAQLAELDERASVTSRAQSVDEAEPGAVPPWVHGIARVADACFTASEPPHPRLVARLIRATEDPGPWIVALLATSVPPGSVIDLAGRLGAERLEHPEFGSGSAAGDTRDLRGILRFMAEVPPAIPRVPRSMLALEDAATHAPPTRRAGILAMLAWGWWMRAQGTTARRLVRDALELDPGNRLAGMVEHLLATPPGWVLSPQYSRPAESSEAA